MKKVTKLILIIIAIILVFELILFIFKNSHNTNYKIKDGDIKYKVNEIYKDKKYYLKVTHDEEIYTFEVDNNFYKRKKIIKKIYTYNGKDYSCIYPKYKKDKAFSNIVCSKDNKTYSYEYFKKDLNSFVEKLKKEGYNSPSWNEKSNKQNTLDTLTIYPNSILDNSYIYIYNYKGFYVINKEEQSNLKILKNDRYKNTLGSQVGKYYLMADYDRKHDYKRFYRIDMTNNKIKNIRLKKKISSDSYVNGVIDDEMYVFDKDRLIQYKINPKKKKQKEVGNKEEKVLNYDLGFERISAYTMRDEKIEFKTENDYIKKIEGSSNIKYMEKNNSSYYYQTKDNNVYYYNTNSKVKVLLFNKPISDFRLIGDTIYFISNDSLYYYNEEYGLNKIVIYNELAFNPENRIAIYME